ncbi:hypothetical protein N0V93_008646 [Gnomoniopsis smithogilvyi]|uniref:Uncharacterized protein n=1 Tax=Gnomoniopsis smithogilvyi TaxID=1191159 RepID=A0A9W8YNL8_9PEZI|nr:hypothetical protein N0V93_008646 [Gnomoniopsis smithogilvyi]
MSWVRNAVKKIEAQDHEILHQTVFGGYGTKTSIFWAVDPIDVPATLRNSVEDTITDDTVGESKCAIIRLETLAGYKDEEFQATGSPVACFSVYTGTHGSDVVYDRQINVYGDDKPDTSKNGSQPTHMWGDIEGNAISKRFRKMSVTMGWTEPPPLIRKEPSAIVGDGSASSPIRAPVADRRLSLAAPDHQYRTEATGNKLARKMSLRPGWMEPHGPSNGTNHDETHDEMLKTALEGLKGFSPTISTDPAVFQESTVAGPSKTTLRNIKKMSMAKRTSYYAYNSEMDGFHVADERIHEQGDALKNGTGLPSTQVNQHEERLLPIVDTHLTEKRDVIPRQTNSISVRGSSQYPERRNHHSGQLNPTAVSKALAAVEWSSTPFQNHSVPVCTEGITRISKGRSGKRISQFKEDDIPEIGEMCMINFHNVPSQPDPAALDDALAALEGTRSPPQELRCSERSEITPRRGKRISAKRVSLYLEEDIPEVGEPQANTPDDDDPVVPVRSHRPKGSVEYALAALQAPTPTQANMGRPRRPNAAARSRKTMSMYIEPSPGVATSQASNDDFEAPRSFFDADVPNSDYESVSRKLKRLSWNVIGRALPEPRQTDGSVHPANAQEPSSTSEWKEPSAMQAKRMSLLSTVQATPEPPTTPHHGKSSTLPWDRPTPSMGDERRAEPVPRKKDRSSWYSMDPTVAEIQCSPRKEYGLPAPWLEPAVQPTRLFEPGNDTSRKSKRTSWYPATKEVRTNPPSPLREVSMDLPGILKESAEDVKPRKRRNRMSKFVFEQEPRQKYTQEVFPRLDGPLNSHPASFSVSRAETPVEKTHTSRMKIFGVQLRRLFR